MLSVILDYVDDLERAIAALDVEVDRVIAPLNEARDRLDTITGVGGDWFVKRTDADKRRDRLIRQLHDLGYGVRLTKVA